MSDGFWKALSDTLVPGDGAFPSASAAGAVERFTDRLSDLRGEGHLAGIAEALGAERSFLSINQNDRDAAVNAYAADRHVDFEEMLAVLYLSYYESPSVTAAIQQTGLTYHNPPQPTGYGMSAFDPDDPLEFPRHGRGRYVATDDVQRVELSALAHLAAPIDRP